jgi:hypothetical protein
MGEPRVGTLSPGVAALGRAPLTGVGQEIPALCREPLRGAGSRKAGRTRGLQLALVVTLALGLRSGQGAPAANGTWPGEYSARQDDARGLLVLSTPYYTIEQDLRRGGAISRITLTYGKATNLLIGPVETRVRDADGTVFSDLKDAAPKALRRREGPNEIVTVESALLDQAGRSPGLRVRSTLSYRWGYVRVRKELLIQDGPVRLREVCPFSTILAPTLSDYGYREGLSEAEGAPPFSFGSNRWGRRTPGQGADPLIHTRHVPRSMMFADPGVEGLEWFASSDLAPWELGPAGQRGQGRCLVQPRLDPPGLELAVSPFWSTNLPVTLSNSCVFDFYLAVPILEGHARQPWVHTSFNRNRGAWVTAEEIQRWAGQGYQTVHCHNDGDYYDDGLFWRDGAYPPYPDMDRFDQVLGECRRRGIRTATYFSNKELHPSTRAYQENGAVWGRQNRQHALQHNFYRGTNEFGVQMCLRSGWLPFLESSIDRVLKNHPLDGVYYDWNVALYCCNPLHEGRSGAQAEARGHWDIDELLELMEWTRKRVGPAGLVIVHNTTTPMFATENFADFVVATEWGYSKWTDRAPDMQDLPLEWSLAGARPRGVISYGLIDAKAPRRLHRLFALEALLGGSSPWPASPETFELLSLLKPVGQLESCRFADWRNNAVSLSDPRCASAVYSRPAEAWLLLANLDQGSREVSCVLHPDRLPSPLSQPTLARLTTESTGAAGLPAAAPVELKVQDLIGPGVKVHIPGDHAVLIQVR